MLIPKPRRMNRKDGDFILNCETVIITRNDEPELKKVSDFIREHLSLATGFSLPDNDNSSRKENCIVLSLMDNSPLGEEGYCLDITEKTIKLSAQTGKGLFWAAQTLRQMLPPEIESSKPVNGIEWSVPCGNIEDSPRFSWRGHLVDSGRLFLDKEYIKRNIDMLSRLKINTLHWHLTEDQGWRIEIKKYPNLSKIGAFHQKEKHQHGYYTQEDIREIVAYAEKRNIMIVPEIDMPGHAFSAIKSYPWLCCTGKPVKNNGFQKDLFCAGDDKVFDFIEDVLREVMDLFPAPYIHIGGDEAPKDRWQECPECQKRIKSEGLKDEKELQKYFTSRIGRFLKDNGRKLIGWEEIIEGGVPDNAVVHWWRYSAKGTEYAVRAVRSGLDVIASPNFYVYISFPLEPTENFKKERTSDLLKVYSAEYVPSELNEEEARKVFGAECCMWNDHNCKKEELDRLAYPRILACAELMWLYPENRDFDEFHTRVKEQYRRLDMLGIEYGAEFSKWKRKIQANDKDLESTIKS